MCGTGTTTELGTAARQDLDLTLKFFEDERAHPMAKRVLVIRYYYSRFLF